jgi:phosphatidylserine/phosphatidylglycerophosphate/cardiolipin synthase-like enzyme
VTKRSLAALAVILFLFPCLPSSEAAEPSALALLEVCPGPPGEFVRIVNLASSSIDLSGWSLGDGEGTLTFANGTSLGPGDTIVVAASQEVTSRYLECEVLDYRDARLTRRGSFQLANGGDQVFLRTPSGEVADVLVYGDAETSMPWIGKPLRTIAKNNDALRVDASKMSMSAWKISVPGRSSLNPDDFTCMAGVFTAPEDAELEVMAFVAAARTSLSICTYQFNHPLLASLLAEKARSGVDISMLIEGEPVAGISDASVTQLHFLEQSGVNVSIMLSRDGYRRYDFVHAKYMVADDDRFLVMSENLVNEALAHNRGWGAIVQSVDGARFLEEMFLEDVDEGKGDIRPAAQAFERVGEFTPPDAPILTSGVSMVPCSARFAISPERSLDALLGLISNATDRLLMEEMQADYDDMSLMGLVEALESSAERGVGVRVLLDSSLDTKDGANRRFTQRIGASVQSRLASDDHAFTTIHNKGIISDDRVLISSINLGSTSIGENRELGVILGSKALADQLAAVFASDWSSDAVAPTITLPWREITVDEGSIVTLDASLCRDASLPMTFAWDVNGDGAAELSGQRVQFQPGVGTHIIRLIATDREGNRAEEAVTVTARANPAASLLPLAGVGMAVPLGILAWKRIKRRQ